MKNTFSILLVAVLFCAMSNLSYSQNVNVTPNAATYATLGAAFTAINAGLHGAGAVAVSIKGNTTELATATLNGGVFTTCSITPVGARTVTGNLAASVIDFNGADNVTIDGLNASGNSLSIINPNASAGANGVQCSNGASNNIIRNLIVVGLGAVAGTAGGRGVNIGQSIAGTSGNNNNIIEVNLINGFRRGIQTFGTAGPTGFTNDGTVIRNNVVKNSTSLHIFVGNEVKDCIIEGNEMFNDAAVAGDAQPRPIGIQGVGIITIRANRIHDLAYASLAPPAVGSANIISGMVIFPQALTAPGSNAATVNVINNFVSMTADNAPAPFIFGIRPSNTGAGTTPYTSNVYNNSVLIAGNTGATIAGFTAAINIDNTVAGSTVRSFNNIAINTRTGGNANTFHVGNDLTAYPTTGITFSADYNFSKATDTTGRGWDGGYAGRVFRNNGLELMKDTACIDGNEQHAMYKNVNFVSTSNLHLAGPIGGDLCGTPLAEVPTDIDGTPRNANYPYRGADESTAFKILTLNVSLEGKTANTQIKVAIKNAACATISTCTADLIVATNEAKLCFGDSVVNGIGYYLDVTSINHLQTSSALPNITFNAAGASYDFTTGPGKAFGNNQTPGVPSSMFGGDVNQDGTIDITDLGLIDNDAFNFLSGCRLKTDVNTDGVVDLTDGAIADNNAFNFVSEVLPCPTPASIISGQTEAKKLQTLDKSNTVLIEAQQ